MPDLPGFGGMDASYKNGKYPSLSFFASHFKHFIDTHVAKDRRLTLFGISFGFQIVTQMLHDYPAECKRVETVVSFAGFVHPSDFSMSLSYKLPLIEGVARTSRTRIGGSVYKALRHERLIVAVYMLTKPIQVKIKTMDRKTARSYAKEQAALWKTNDARTQGATAWDFVKKNDLTDYRIEADLVYLGVPNDHILDSSRVKSELEHMYGNMSAYDLLLDNHAPLDIETSAKVRAVLPKPFIESMKKSSNKVAVI